MDDLLQEPERRIFETLIIAAFKEAGIPGVPTIYCPEGEGNRVGGETVTAWKVLQSTG